MRLFFKKGDKRAKWGVISKTSVYFDIQKDGGLFFDIEQADEHVEKILPALKKAGEDPVAYFKDYIKQLEGGYGGWYRKKLKKKGLL